ncbi:hypothetical protein EV368DRAFT_48698 [Lentinula lateritia]|uniref:Uncharacterized protein n=1 Tax=Lentinula aff. lateritia TaxID=2804960 RepID=A0ACC1U8Z0_9AGAR|nr:hypothetical protein F5876DRAFT_74009 [Lentinula aff. lateritia]KAJ3848737.1 hypothetical protein EV368DRAFT_48698 [Lentinula lateritia]
MTTPPLSPDAPFNFMHGETAHVDNEELSIPSAPATPQPKITRTVAIIKHHALEHRFDIESRIQEASFEIVKERQMEFDVSDPDTLYELFGEDAESFADGPVWVYVLERRRAVEVFQTLMGDRDPEAAKKATPHSLRALYGVSMQQNAVMGSPDSEMAEIQIASLFASSPPFPTSDLPSDDGRFATMRSVSSSILSNLRKATSDEGYAASSATNDGSRGSGSGKALAANGKPLFKARGLPSTHEKPDIVPRTTRAASLRAGFPLEKSPGPRKPPTKEQLAKTFANVPGHKRTDTITVASTAAPAIAPRLTKAAALRLGLPPPPPTVRRQSSSSFEGVPGHKRRESIVVASTQEPTVKPKLNKSASLRVSKDNAPPTSFMFRGPTEPKLPARSSSRLSTTGISGNAKPSRPSSAASTRPPSSYPGRPLSVARGLSNVVRPMVNSRTKTTVSVTTPDNGTNNIKGSPSLATSPPSEVVDKPKLTRRPSSVSLPPSIAPRTNKSAALRAAKKEQEAAAAAALAAKQQRRASRPPPSSMPKSLIV